MTAVKTVMFVKGTTYLVAYKVEGLHRKRHSFVGTYLGLNIHTGELEFSLRPVAGTCSVDAKSIVSYIESTQTPGIKT